MKKTFLSIQLKARLSCLKGTGLFRILLLALVLLLATPFSSLGDPLPKSIGSFQLEQKKSGDEARQEIYKLHGKRLIFKTGSIGHYKEGNKKATVWISEYDSEGEAIKEIGKMASGVKASEGKAFWHFREMTIEGLKVYFVLGMGQAHYFFQKKKMAIWLAVDASTAKEAIRDLTKKIP